METPKQMQKKHKENYLPYFLSLLHAVVVYIVTPIVAFMLSMGIIYKDTMFAYIVGVLFVLMSFCVFFISLLLFTDLCRVCAYCMICV